MRFEMHPAVGDEPARLLVEAGSDNLLRLSRSFAIAAKEGISTGNVTTDDGHNHLDIRLLCVEED